MLGRCRPSYAGHKLKYDIDVSEEEVQKLLQDEAFFERTAPADSIIKAISFFGLALLQHCVSKCTS